MNTLKSAIVGVGLSIFASQGISQEQGPLLDLISKKRAQVIQTMNNLLITEKKGPLISGQECVITIVGKPESLKAVLACDATIVLTHEATIPRGEVYVTQITGLKVQGDGKFSINDGCFTIESRGKQIMGGSHCSIPDEVDKQPNKGIPRGRIVAI